MTAVNADGFPVGLSGTAQTELAESMALSDANRWRNMLDKLAEMSDIDYDGENVEYIIDIDDYFELVLIGDSIYVTVKVCRKVKK